ncbi:6-phosphofructokinase [Methanospirillum purgamenti]|jgi:6-phosphofructokinase 1|uniref:6-phosphofructokinase n=1 Tax=Methanospirillum purgamenti TaxID=2834276 RepID=UPI0020290F94|nr:MULTISPECIES: ATP-dependent 6-phosphofructokinase [Methanospirillum]MDX8550753.1 ATP-dependent 6-phosphofructokinase [Methanospirillum hungatei]
MVKKTGSIKTIGILTGGGDCPGLNAVIRAVVKTAHLYDYTVIGIRNGWKGIVEGEVEPLTEFSVTGILPKGGTILGTSRTNPLKSEEQTQQMLTNIRKFGLDAIVAVGGDDTLSVATRLHQMHIPVVGIPKTIDNDLSGTDYTFGFDTAVAIVTDAIDRLHTTAESHHRIMVLEVMGRHAGWIATMAGIAGGADQILIPEVPFDIEDVCEGLKKRRERGKKFSIVVIAEGAKPADMTGFATTSSKVDDFGHEQLGGIGHLLGRAIEERIGSETRVTVLGHVQRGGSPTAHDRVLATRYGVKAVEQLHEGNYGVMVALQGDKIVPIPLSDAITQKKVDPELYEMARIFY